MNVNARRAVARNREAGLHYFDADTMAAFGSTIHKAYEASDGTIYVVMSNRWGIDHDAPESFTYHTVTAVGLDGRTMLEGGHMVMDGIVPDRSTAWTMNQATIYARARAVQ